MRIVGGKHRGRVLKALPGRRLRPTSERTREALFNILSHAAFAGPEPVRDARVLDAFAGTGALGLEALSRGAAHVTFLEKETAALRLIEGNAAALGAGERATCRRADATRPPPAGTPCGLAFLDPPYGSGLAAPALTALAAAGWFAPGAVIVLETAKTETFAPPPGFALLDARTYGGTRLLFLRRAADVSAARTAVRYPPA